MYNEFFFLEKGIAMTRLDSFHHYYLYHPSYTYTPPPPEMRFSIKKGQDPLCLRIKCIFLNIITFGIWGGYQNYRFEQALKNNDTAKAQRVFAKGCVYDLGEEFVESLIRENKKESLQWLIKKESEISFGMNCERPIAIKTFKKRWSRADFQEFFKGMPADARLSMGKDIVSCWGGFEITKICIENGLDPRNAIYQGRHVVFLSEGSSKEYLEKLRYFLDLGIDPNLTQNKDTILTHFVQSVCDHESQYNDLNRLRTNYDNDAVKVVQLLLERGALPDIPGRHLKTPLNIASYTRSCECHTREAIVEVLLNHGSDPNFRTKESDPSPYENALSDGSVKIIQLMHEKGGNTTQEHLNKAFRKTISEEPWRYSKGDPGVKTCETEKLEKMKLLKSFGAATSTKILTAAFNAAITDKLVDKARFLRDCGADTSVFDSFTQAVAKR